MFGLFLIAAVSMPVFACSWDYPIWIPRTKSADPLYRFVVDDKAGYIDATGKVVIPPVLPFFRNHFGEFHEGLLHVSSLGAEYVDVHGKPFRVPAAVEHEEFSEGLALAKRKGEERRGFIDRSGEFLIAPRFGSPLTGLPGSFSEGLAQVDVNGKAGFIDRSGEFAIPPRFLDASPFQDGFARVVIDGPCTYFSDRPCGSFNPISPGAPDRYRQSHRFPPCKFTYIDKNGRIITPPRFDYARDFSDGLAAVQVADTWGFIDKTGTFAILPRFQTAWQFSSGLARIRVGKLFGYADKSGQVVIPPAFEEAGDFIDGLAAVGNNQGRYWYIDTRGQRAFPEEFERASPFFKGLAHVKLILPDQKDSFAYIDTKGKVVFRY